jgi:hypothetical protein
MHKGCRDQNSGTEMLSAKEEGRWYAKARKFGDKQWETAASRGYKENDEEAGNMEP